MINAYEQSIDEIHIPIIPTDGSPTKQVQKSHLRSLMRDKVEP